MPKFISWFKRTDVSNSRRETNRRLRRLQVKRMSSEKPLARRPWLWLGLGISSGAIALIGVWVSIERSLPETAELFTLVRNETITIKAADGTILQQQGPATRQHLHLDEIPKPLLQAFIASEDRRFYQHHGIDYQGIIRAFYSNLRSAELVEGGSTITQQLARMLFLNQERTLWRKLKEMRLSEKIEQKLTKEQILERYLNLVYLGEGAYGVADAAWVYFSKPVSQLTLPEMAAIAGLAPAPSLYSPTVNLKAAEKRRDLVLQRLREDGMITATDATEASVAPLVLKPSLPKRLQVQAPYFTTYIQQELPKYISAEVLEAGGLTIETSLNPQWQKQAETVVKNTIANNGRWQHFEQAALVTIEPRSGEIKALVGGKDFFKNQFNRVTQAQRQPGSTFKGFVYTAAIASGISPYKSYLDAPYIVEGYEPQNYSHKYRGWLTIKDALAASINVIAVKALLDVGFEPTIQLAHRMGIKSQLKPTYSLALGSWEVNLLELTSAYGTLAAEGVHTEVHGIRRILNRSGEVIYTTKYQPVRVLDRDSAAIATWMLKSVVQSGTGSAAQLNRPVAGKTGTSDNSRDLWFIGYIPQLVTGVWLGNDNNAPTWGSSSTAALIWRQFMVKAIEKMPLEEFPQRPKLEGRVGSIKAQPIKPKRVFSGKIRSDVADSQESEPNRSYRRRSRRYYQQNQEATEQKRSPTPGTPSATNQPSSQQSDLVRRLRQQQPITPSVSTPSTKPTNQTVTPQPQPNSVVVPTIQPQAPSQD